MSNSTLAALVDHDRADWWHDDPRPRPLTAVTHPYIEVHHSAVRGHYQRLPADVLRDIERGHRNRGWNGIFYGLLIDLDGEIWEARGVGWRSIGDHRARYDDGTVVDPAALTVLLPGDYRFDPVTLAQEHALDRLRAAAPDAHMHWHGQRDATECCGTRAISTVRTLNARPPHTTPPQHPQTEDDMLLLIKVKGTDPVYLFDGRWRWPVDSQAKMDVLTSPYLPDLVRKPDGWEPGKAPWHEWAREHVEAFDIAPSGLNVDALAAAIAKRLPPGTTLDPDALAAEVVDEIAGRLTA